MNRDCDAARGAMPEALSGEMRAADLERLESHLADCPPCDAEMDRHRTALRLLGEDDVPDPGPAYWAAFTGRLRRRIAASGAAGKRSRFRLALAATVVLAAGLALFAAGRILRGPVTISGPAGTGTRATGTLATDGSIEADEGAEARLRALVDAASRDDAGRRRLRAILDEMNLSDDALGVDEDLGAMSPAERRDFFRDIAGSQG